MTRIIGDVAAVDRVPTEGTVIVQSVEMRPGATLVVTGEPKQYPIAAGRFVVEDAEPGPTRFIIQGGGAHHEVRVTVPNRTEVTFLELLESVFEWEPAFIAQGAAILKAAREAAAAAEVSADRIGSAEQIKAWTESSSEDAAAAGASASAAAGSEAVAVAKAGEASASASAAKTSEDNAKASEDSAAGSAGAAASDSAAAGVSAAAAKSSEDAAKSSESAAKVSETNAASSATSAADARNSAQSYAGTAQTQAQAAQTSAGTASTKAGEASSSASAAKVSENKAKASETAAASSASTASQASTVAQDAAVVATAAAQSVTTYSGTGSPEGKVTAGVGALYVDSVATCGAVTWRKVSGTGNTGWSVENGDTGWRDVTSQLRNGWTADRILLRRQNNTVTLSSLNLSPENATSALFITLPDAFHSPRTFISITTPSGPRAAFWSSSRELTFSNHQNWAKSSYASSLSSWQMEPSRGWPTTLPGTPA